ncbi:hypothetical protein BDP67DRAFT_354661, partial [Colletotrichum lupini]
IRGNLSKSKIILLYNIINELKKELFNRLSYFFYQATIKGLNSIIAVLRGLIY